MVAGAITLHVDDAPLTLSAGDAVVIPKGQPHRWANDGAEAAQVLFVSTRFDG